MMRNVWRFKNNCGDANKDDDDGGAYDNDNGDNNDDYDD